MFHFKHLSGFQIFTIIWFGQLVSILGTGMTRFALLIWAYDQTAATGQPATTLALLGFASWLPFVLISPLAGVWVDRLDRRLVMILADLAAGLMTLIVLALFLTNRLAIWHLFFLEAAASAFEAFQAPAYTVTTSLLLTKAQYARASAMRSLAADVGLIGAPILGGLLMAMVGLSGVMLIDVATFLIAVTSLLLVRIPILPPLAQGEAEHSFGQRVATGFRYLQARKGLLGLGVIFFGINFFAAFTYYAVLPALILARTSGDEVTLGIVQATLGGAGIVGGLLMGIWGLPKRKIHAVLGFGAISFLSGDLLFATGRTLPIWVCAATVAAVFIPFISGGNQIIWQIKTPPALQGRVFALRGLLQNAAMPLGYLLSAGLADRFFESSMQPNGSLAPIFGWLVGVGQGAGIGLMFVCTGLLGTVTCLAGYMIPAVRNVETDLPDHDSVQTVAP